MVKFDKYIYNVIFKRIWAKKSFWLHGYIKDITIILVVYSFSVGDRLVMCEIS